jgi:hypothetical protein
MEGRDAFLHLDEATMPMRRGSKAKTEKFLAYSDSASMGWKD